MEDVQIIKMFHQRSENAVEELSNKYGGLCRSVARRILCSKEDIEECLNDVLLAVWDTVPPENPNPLSAYVCKITRNLSLKKYQTNTAKKRDSTYNLALDELEESLAGSNMVEEEILARELERSINDFLSELKRLDRVLFVRRYWFCETVSEIADSIGKSNNYVTVHLFRCRARLEKYLKDRGLV